MRSTSGSISHYIKLWPPLLLFLGVSVVSAVYMFAVYQMNSRLGWHDKSDFFLHVLLSSGVVLVLFISLALWSAMSPASSQGRGKSFITFVSSCYFLFLSLFYPLSLTANFSWGDNITLSLVYEYLTQIPLLLRILPVSTFSAYLILCCVLTIYVSLFFLFRKISTTSFTAFLDAHLLGKRWHARHSVGLGLLVLAGYTYLAVSVVQAAPQYKFWKEPFTDFYLPSNHVPADMNPQRLYVAQQDRQSRQVYPKPKLLPNTPNVILILVDSLRPDHMGVYGYHRPTTPFLSQLHASGHLRTVQLAVSTCPNTYCGVLSMFTSKPYRDISDDNFKIYDLLRDLGYTVHFIVAGSHRNWYNLDRAYGTEINSFFDYRHTQLSANDDQILIEGVERLAPFAKTPAFFYFHLMSVHVTGLAKEEYSRFQPVTISEGSLLKIRTNRYDNSVLQADAHIQKIMKKLEERGYLDNSLVVITSDHGENLGEDGDLPDHGWNLHQHQIRIPLLIYDRTSTVYQDLAFARQIDIAPTISARLGLPLPSVWSGHSLLTYTAEKCSYHESVKGRPSRSVICRRGSNIYKYIVQQQGLFAAQREELYEITSDPKEENNLVGKDPPEVITYLREKFSNHWLNQDIARSH